MKNLFDMLLLEVQANSGQSFAVTGRTDPYKAFNFRVTITGKKVFGKLGFQKVSGLKAKTDVVEYRDGNDSGLAIRESAGLIKFDPITLERGMSEDEDMIEWFELNAKADQSGASNDSQMSCQMKIELLDRDRTVVKTWDVIDCWVAEYESADFDAQSNNIAIEKITVHHHGWNYTNGKAAN